MNGLRGHIPSPLALRALWSREDDDMDRIPKHTKAEQETLFRFDCEERVLWASTTSQSVARRWTRARIPLVVLSRYLDGTPATWEAKLPWAGQKRAWLRLFSLSLPSAAATAREGAEPIARRIGLPANGTRGRGWVGPPVVNRQNVPRGARPVTSSLALSSDQPAR